MDLVPPMVVVSVSIASSVLLFSLLRKALRRSRIPEVLHGPLLSIAKFPVSIAIVGYALVWTAEYYHALFPTLFPPFLGPTILALLIQLIVLASALHVGASLVRRLTLLITEDRSVARVLVFNLYAAGLIALLYIGLTSPLSPWVAQSIWTTIYFVIGLFTTYLVVHVLDMIIKRYIQAYVEREPRLRTAYTFIRRLGLIVVALVGVSATTFITFPTAGGAISSLFIAAGFTSIVVGLAAQSSLSNIVAGILISLSQPFRIGDAISFKNESCVVEDIKLVHTVLRTWDNRRLMVPNSLLQSEMVVNYTAEDPTMLVPILLQISYESDLDKAMKIMREAALRHPEYMPAENLPNVVVMEYAESGINLRLLSRTKDRGTAFGMTRDLLYTIKKEFDAEGIEIPYPRRYLVFGREVEELLTKVAARMGRGGEG